MTGAHDKGLHWRRIAFGMVVAALCGGAILSFRSPILRNTAAGRRTTALIIGADGVADAVHADTVLIVSYEPRHRVVDVVSIPRDTRIDEPRARFRKVAEVYAFYQRETGGDRLAAGRMLADALGRVIGSSMPLVFDYVAVVSYESFRQLLDVVGPVTITVTEPMHYQDIAGGLHIHFEPGTYRMDATRALEYVRYRDEMGDLGRIGRQQQFMRAVVSRFMVPWVVLKMPVILWRISQVIVSDMTLWDAVAVAVEVRRLPRSAYWFSTLTGKPQGRYLIVDEADREMLRKRLAGALHDEERRCIVKVYNASSIPRMALRATEFLRQKGYDVIDWATWWRILPHSRIIDCTGNPKAIRRLAGLLDIEDISTNVAAQRPGEVVDIMIVLGEDARWKRHVLGPLPVSP